MDNSIAYKLAQLPENALVVGVDPHKKSHAICVQDRRARIIAQLQISNDRSGFDHLLERCACLVRQEGAAACLFAIEPGSHYWRNLAYFLVEQGQTLRLVNPFTLKRERDGNDLMRKKNDKRDAQMAGNLLREGKYTWTTLPQGAYADLRRAHQTYKQLVTDVARVRIQLTTTLDALFPEFTSVFKSVTSETALTVLRICPKPADICAVGEAAFVQRIRAAYSKKRMASQKVRHLYRLAGVSVGIQAGAQASSEAVRLLADRLIFLEHQRQSAEDYLVMLFRQCEGSRYLLSMHGLGPVNGAGLLAQIGDIRCYSSVKALAKMAGVVPTQNSSADHQSGRTPMSKRGRPDFRTVVFQSVIGLVRHNPVFKQYVCNLTERRPKDHPLKKREALGAAMNKLLRIVHALLTKQEMFDATQALAA